VVVSRGVWGLRDGTPPNKEKPFQTRKTLSKQGKPFPNKEKPFQTRKNTTKQENRLSSKKNTFQNKKNTFRARETPFKQGVSSNQM
jgi:hypothetical protein